MKVFIPTPLRSYTAQRGEVDSDGATLADVLNELDRRHPGLRFRIISEQDQIREHIKIFINQDQEKRLDAAVKPQDAVHIICALSGG